MWSCTRAGDLCDCSMATECESKRVHARCGDCGKARAEATGAGAPQLGTAVAGSELVAVVEQECR